MADSSINHSFDEYIIQLNDAKPPENFGSVLYVMRYFMYIETNFGLISAQKFAQQCSVPMAVLFCMDPDENYKDHGTFSTLIRNLEALEKQLEKKNVPLMLLVGDSLERLAACMYHLRPAAMFFDSDTGRATPIQSMAASAADCPVFLSLKIKENDKNKMKDMQVKRHLYVWHGPVLKIADIMDKIETVRGKIEN